MTPSKLTFCFLVLIGQVLVFKLDWSAHHVSTVQYIIVGLVIGTGNFHVLFAGLMARATCFRKKLRLVGSIGWLLLTILSFAIGDSDRGGFSLDYILAMSASFTIAWMLALFLSLLSPWRLINPSHLASPSPCQDWHQFGIRTLLTLTTAVAVLIACIRLAVLNVHWPTYFQHELRINSILGTQAVFTTLPILMSILLIQKRAVLFIALAMLNAVMLGYPTLHIMRQYGYYAPDMGHVVAITTVESMWAILFGLWLRASGYRVSRVRSQPPSVIDQETFVDPQVIRD